MLLKKIQKCTGYLYYLKNFTNSFRINPAVTHKQRYEKRTYHYPVSNSKLLQQTPASTQEGTYYCSILCYRLDLLYENIQTQLCITLSSENCCGKSKFRLPLYDMFPSAEL